MRSVKLCPKCKQAKLKPAMNVSGWLAPNLLECTNCNYIGAFYIEVNADEFEKIKEGAFNGQNEDKKSNTHQV
jgi:hypothetical protein